MGVTLVIIHDKTKARELCLWSYITIGGDIILKLAVVQTIIVTVVVLYSGFNDTIGYRLVGEQLNEIKMGYYVLHHSRL